MATYTANIATTQTLSANTVDTVTLTSPATRVTVTCSSAVGAGTVYFTVGSGSATTPTVGGSNAYAVVAGSSFTVDFDGSFPTVKLISSAALTYTVAAASVFNKLADNTVDNSTLQISNGIVSVKDGGIGTSKLDSTVNTYLTNSGLVYVKQQTIGNGVSSVTVNNAFSSDFDNYKIMISGGATSGNSALTVQLGSSTANYYFSLIYVSYTSTTVFGLAGTGTTGFTYAGVATPDNIVLEVDLISPYATKTTAIRGTYMETRTGGVGGTISGFHNSATSYTSFTIISPSATMTGGTIRVYGYRQA